MLKLLSSGKTKVAKSVSFNNNKTESFLKMAVMGTLYGFAVTVGFIAIFAFAMLLFKIDRIYASLFATLSVSVGSFASALYAGKRVKLKGVFSGLLTGLCYFVIILAVSLLTDKSGFSSNTAFHFVIIILSGAVGGIIGANRK